MRGLGEDRVTASKMPLFRNFRVLSIDRLNIYNAVLMHAYIVALTVIEAFLRVETVHTQLKVVLLNGSEPLGRSSIKTLRISTLMLFLLITFDSFDTQPGLKLRISPDLVLVIELLHVFVTSDFHRGFRYLVKWDELGLVLFPTPHEGFCRLHSAASASGLALDVFVIVVILLNSLTAQSRTSGRIRLIIRAS